MKKITHRCYIRGPLSYFSTYRKHSFQHPALSQQDKLLSQHQQRSLELGPTWPCCPLWQYGFPGFCLLEGALGGQDLRDVAISGFSVLGASMVKGEWNLAEAPWALRLPTSDLGFEYVAQTPGRVPAPWLTRLECSTYMHCLDRHTILMVSFRFHPNVGEPLPIYWKPGNRGWVKREPLLSIGTRALVFSTFEFQNPLFSNLELLALRLEFNHWLLVLRPSDTSGATQRLSCPAACQTEDFGTSQPP